MYVFIKSLLIWWKKFALIFLILLENVLSDHSLLDVYKLFCTIKVV